MPNLYITNNNTKTVMGLTPERKTTPSLVVTCGTTTYYGSLTTCADWATEPNKIVVTSGSTTYYTMAPAKGTKYVNFITPTECKAIEGTVMNVCCVGIAGNCDSTKQNNITVCEFRDTGAYGDDVLPQSCTRCYAFGLYESPDTSIERYGLIIPKLNHKHSISPVMDDAVVYCRDIEINTRHKGVRVCTNYNVSPDYIYVGCDERCFKSGCLNYDYLCINGQDNNIDATTFCLRFCLAGGWGVGNTSVDIISPGEQLTYFTDWRDGDVRGAAVIGREIGCNNYYKLCHTHYPYHNVGSGINYDWCVATHTYNDIYSDKLGIQLPWFGVNMKCYDNDIDKLPSGSILFTNCPISCFDQRCWECFTGIRCCSQCLKEGALPYVNSDQFYTGVISSYESAMFHFTPACYPSTLYKYDGTNIKIKMQDLDLIEDMEHIALPCGWFYCPVMSIRHEHPNPSSSNCLYVYTTICMTNASSMDIVSPGKYLICHK